MVERKEMPDYPLIKALWTDYTSRIGPINGVSSQKWYEFILTSYSSPNRKYHNLHQLENDLKLFTEHENHVFDKVAFVFALFFKYLEYDPSSSTSCHGNIEHFKKFLEDLGVENVELWENVSNLMKVAGDNITEEHMCPDLYGEQDKHYFLDIDTAILGYDPEIYKIYIKEIGEEYDFLDEHYYKNLRIKTLQSFLLIPNIYATKLFRDKYEQKARDNIKEEIVTLKAVLG